MHINIGYVIVNSQPRTCCCRTFDDMSYAGAGLVKPKTYDWKDSNLALFGSDTEKQVKSKKTPLTGCFCRAMLCIARTMSLQDICPSHASILSKRLNISSNKLFHCRVATPF